MRTSLTLPLIVLLTGCGANTLTQSWQLDRLRILGVRATPAEPQPGELTTFESLVYVPSGMTLDGVVWFGCLPQSADEFGCELDTTALEDLESATYEELVEAGFIGFEPLFPPTWVPPADALDGMTEQEQQEGLSALINLTALPDGAEDDGDIELAYKRVPVSLAKTPNHNPDITGLLIDGEPLTPGEPLSVTSGQVVEIDPVMSETSIEDYTYTTSDGVTETRTEEPYFTWYTEAGTFDQPYSLYPYTSVEWTAPYLKSGQEYEGLMLVVLRDRRGGMAWTELTVKVTP
jgi:hypothetical protein